MLQLIQSNRETPQEAMTRWEKEGLVDPNCPNCKEYYEAVEQGQMPYSVFGPRHKAQDGCRSGQHSHCTCDVCF